MTVMNHAVDDSGGERIFEDLVSLRKDEIGGNDAAAPLIFAPDGLIPPLPVAEKFEPESHSDSKWISRHRFEFDDTCVLAMADGVSGAAIVPGNADESLLVKIQSKHPNRLPADAIQWLVEWINNGAPENKIDVQNRLRSQHRPRW